MCFNMGYPTVKGSGKHVSNTSILSSSRGNIYPENYFNIDDILAAQQRLVCTFESSVANMGYLDPSSVSNNIEERAKIELPVWLARIVCGSKRRRLASVTLPKQYGEVYREILNAEAGVVDLHRLGPYYFNVGSLLVRQFDHIEFADISRSLLKAFQARLRKIMDGCLNALDTDFTKLMETMDESERALFEHGATGLAGYLKWESRQLEKLTSSTMVTNMKKRKHAQMESSDNVEQGRRR